MAISLKAPNFFNHPPFVSPQFSIWSITYNSSLPFPPTPQLPPLPPLPPPKDSLKTSTHDREAYYRKHERFEINPTILSTLENIQNSLSTSLQNKDVRSSEITP